MKRLTHDPFTGNVIVVLRQQVPLLQHKVKTPRRVSDLERKTRHSINGQSRTLTFYSAQLLSSGLQHFPDCINDQLWLLQVYIMFAFRGDNLLAMG